MRQQTDAMRRPCYYCGKAHVQAVEYPAIECDGNCDARRRTEAYARLRFGRASEA